jgi:uncharacterized membrane protein
VAGESGAAGARAQVGKMRTKEFLSKLEHDRIVRAIRDAEAGTSGEIRVYIQRGELSVDPLSAARKRFQRLGMHRTRHRNAVLIFVAPRAHKFAIFGDMAVDEHAGHDFWESIVSRMREHFQNERFSEAIVDAVKDIGRALAEHFPGKNDDGNELPNEIIEG